tara:strand:+ start:722 stop:1810 length:1089 start_codon:yes stop_codon:yes gene_type:complete
MLGIVTPTKNRSEYIIRQLYYYVSVECPYTIYIGDSSDAAHEKRILSVIDKLRGRVKVVYRKIDSSVCSHGVLGELVGLVKEKYITYVGDDDFLVSDSLGKCIEFLEVNPEYVTVQGKGVLFGLDKKGAYGDIEAFGLYSSRGCEMETPIQRLHNILNDYWVLDFSVFRTEEYRQIADCRNMQSTGFVSDALFTEILIGWLSLIRGKSKGLDCLYLFRQVGHHRYDWGGGTLEWITKPDWRSSYKIFHDNLTEALTQQANITREAASDIVKQAFWKHFAGGVCRLIQRQKASKKRIIAFRDKVKRIPCIKYLYKNIKRRIPGVQKAFCLENLLKRSSPYHKDFMSVYNVITSSEEKIASEIF